MSFVPVSACPGKVDAGTGFAPPQAIRDPCRSGWLFLGGQVHIERLPLYRRDFLMPLERRAG